METTKIQWVSQRPWSVHVHMQVYVIRVVNFRRCFKHPTFACPKRAALKWKQYMWPLYDSMARGQPATNRNIHTYICTNETIGVKENQLNLFYFFLIKRTYYYILVFHNTSNSDQRKFASSKEELSHQDSSIVSVLCDIAARPIVTGYCRYW